VRTAEARGVVGVARPEGGGQVESTEVMMEDRCGGSVVE
jgi:hypothetical protein